jgi:aerobic C4-dicarboxylate transport protein
MSASHLVPAPSNGTRNSRAYLYVLVGILCGAALGVVAPGLGVKTKIFADLFLRAIKMLVGPIIFCTVVHGIASLRTNKQATSDVDVSVQPANAGNLRKAGRISVLAFVYFEAMTSLALALGLSVGHLVRSLRITQAMQLPPPSGKDLERLGSLAKESKSFSAHLLDLLPESFVGAFVSGESLAVLTIAVLSGVALVRAGDAPWSQRALTVVDDASSFFFQLMKVVMLAAPLGAFGAMAFTVSQYGVGALANLAQVVAAFYVSAAAFVAIPLALVLRRSGVSMLALLRYLKQELLLVLATSSSESALPQLMEKLEALGCDRATVRLVVPTGYSFNLDGTCIYLSLAVLFAADVTGTSLTFLQELGILAVLLLTSKGAAAVSGGGFVTLTATLSASGRIPLAGIAPLFGIDRFMSEARAITNLIGNAVATITVARWTGGFDEAKAQRAVAASKSTVPAA